VRGMIAAGHLGSARQAGLGGCERLLTDDGWHRDGHPLLGRSWPPTAPRPYWTQGRVADAGWHWTGPLARGGACIDRRAEDAAHGGDIPARPPAWSGDVGIRKALGDAVQRGPGLWVGIPGEDLGHHRGFDRVDPQAPGIAGALGSHEIAIRWHAPRPQLATAQPGLAAASHPVGDEGALVLGHRAPDLEEELIVGILTHGPLQKFHLAPPRCQFLEEAHVMDIVPGHAVSQAIQAGTVELGSAIAVITVDVLLCKMPVGPSREVLAQASPLLLNRLGVLLPGGRDTDIPGYFQGTPPAGVMAQDTCLHSYPSPIAEGTGRPYPTVVHRRSVRSPCAVSARVCSWVPPASNACYAQKDTPAMGLAPPPQGAPPPGYLEHVPSGAAEFVICDHTIELLVKELKGATGLGQHQVTKDPQRVERSVAMSVMAYLMIVKFRAQDIPEQGPWSLFTLKQNFTWQLVQGQLERTAEQRLRKALRERAAA
jgi:hypothetical protein